MESVVTAKIVAYDGKFLKLAPLESINRFMEQKDCQIVELRLQDGRTITASQRKKIFGLIRDISIWSGHEPEEIRALMTWDFCLRSDKDFFSLSDTDVSTAREFIDYLIEFCFSWSVPTRDTLLNQTDDISKYLYQCLEHRKCAICNDPADVHHVNRIGMGRDRERVVHIGLLAIALCRNHHEEAHQREKDLFEENHVYGIKLDEYLCKKLNLNTKNRRLNDGKNN